MYINKLPRQPAIIIVSQDIYIYITLPFLQRHDKPSYPTYPTYPPPLQIKPSFTHFHPFIHPFNKLTKKTKRKKDIYIPVPVPVPGCRCRTSDKPNPEVNSDPPQTPRSLELTNLTNLTLPNCPLTCEQVTSHLAHQTKPDATGRDGRDALLPNYLQSYW